MGEYFGTDGIRGIPGEFPLVKDFVARLGYEAAKAILSGPRRSGSAAPEVLLARDSRDSGKLLGKWLTLGMQAAGCRVTDIGVAPTPAVSFLAPRRRAAFGAVISASHNPAEFNGIKFFSGKGVKLSERAERAIEAALKKNRRRALPARIDGEKYRRAPELLRDYEDFIVGTIAPAGAKGAGPLSGMKVVLDCAHGAACASAPRALARLGAKVYAIGCVPDGKNINAGVGALYTAAMSRETVRRGADCGFSLDGDADRVIFADETGAVFDGDDIIAMAALEMKREGRLRRSKVVLTVMSNCGIINRLREEGIKTVQVPVGDKYVTRAIDGEKLSLGGEASGHIIFRDFSPTGDGLLTAVQVLALLRRSGRKLGDYRKLLPKYPQSLRAVAVSKKVPLESIPGFARKLRDIERGLGGGRVFVRYSGTEPKLRVLAEGPDAPAVENAVREIISYYEKHTEGILCR